MGDPFLAQVNILSFQSAPQGWAHCNGQLLPINQNQALFALLGTNYGGNGQTTFALPNLRGRVPIHRGNGFSLGQSGGETVHTLTVNEMPQHTHLVSAVDAAGTLTSPVGNVWAQAGAPIYNSSPNTAMRASAVTSVGGSQAHENMSPYLALSFCIALQGIFPSQN